MHKRTNMHEKNHAENVHQKLIPDPFLILEKITQNRHGMQGILLQIRYFERELSKSFKKINFIFLSNHMSSVCHSYVIRMSLVCTRMSFVCTCMSSVCHSYVLLCHSYVTRVYSYVIVCYP